jgi:hypothetical protein
MAKKYRVWLCLELIDEHRELNLPFGFEAEFSSRSKAEKFAALAHRVIQTAAKAVGALK